MSMINELSLQIIGSLSGGVVGGFSGFIAGSFNERRARQERLKNIASALIGEIGVLSRRFKKNYLEILEIDFQSGDVQVLYPFHYMRGEQDFMPIFHSLGGDIGCLPAPLPHDLVSWYTSLAIGQERARALHDLAVRGDDAVIERIADLASDQHKTFSELVEKSASLIARLSAL